MLDQGAQVEEPDGDLPQNIPPLIVGISLVYSLVLASALGWCYLAEIPLFVAEAPGRLLVQFGLAIVVGMILVLVIGVWRSRSDMFDMLEGAVRARLGDLSRSGVLALALLSSAAEEVFFRAAIQSTLGHTLSSDWAALILTSVLFGILHMGRNRSYFPWTVFAAGAGVILGYSFMITGNIAVPILIHFLINAVNMWRIIFSQPEPLDRSSR